MEKSFNEYKENKNISPYCLLYLDIPRDKTIWLFSITEKKELVLWIERIIKIMKQNFYSDEYNKFKKFGKQQCLEHFKISDLWNMLWLWKKYWSGKTYLLHILVSVKWQRQVLTCRRVVWTISDLKKTQDIFLKIYFPYCPQISPISLTCPNSTWHLSQQSNC